MAEYIKLTWQKLAIILISIMAFVIGFSYCGAYSDYKSRINDIEAVEDVAPIKAQA